jgi:hypothetical protein
VNEFGKLFRYFSDASCSNNDRLLFNAVSALITIAERQQEEIEALKKEIGNEN